MSCPLVALFAKVWRMALGSSESTREARFHTTQWTQVLEACEGGIHIAAREALSNLCRCYWYPLYAYVRRKGKQRADAEDLTQGFLSELLSKNRLAQVHPSKGRFRTFLLTCFDNYIADRRDHDHAKKRGGGQPLLSLDWELAESRYAYEPVDESTPETLYERTWALEVLTRTLSRLRDQCESTGKGPQFRELKVFLTGDAAYGATQAIAETLQMNEASVRVAVNRLRTQYRNLLRQEIADTVSGDVHAIEAEYQHVADILRGSR